MSRHTCNCASNSKKDEERTVGRPHHFRGGKTGLLPNAISDLSSATIQIWLHLSNQKYIMHFSHNQTNC